MMILRRLLRRMMIQVRNSWNLTLVNCQRDGILPFSLQIRFLHIRLRVVRLFIRWMLIQVSNSWNLTLVNCQRDGILPFFIADPFPTLPTSSNIPLASAVTGEKFMLPWWTVKEMESYLFSLQACLSTISLQRRPVIQVRNSSCWPDELSKRWNLTLFIADTIPPAAEEQPERWIFTCKIYKILKMQHILSLSFVFL